MLHIYKSPHTKFTSMYIENNIMLRNSVSILLGFYTSLVFFLGRVFMLNLIRI